MPRPNAPKRSRKRSRRPASARPAPARTTAAELQAARVAAPEATSRSAAAASDRPRAPWHPFPLTEIAILAGAIALIVALARPPGSRAVPMVVGLVVLGSAVIELCWREHRAGFRSHSTLLAFAPAVAVTAVMVAIIGPGWSGLLALAGGVPIFLGMFAWLRRRYQAAQLSPRG